MKPDRTWIVIADGANAKVFEHSADNPKLEPVRGVGFATRLPRTRELVTDRLVRSFESQGRARHAKTERTDPHRELKRTSAEKLAGMLEAQLAAKRYERLVLVAPPVTLGDLRDALAKGVRVRVAGELAQDLVKTPQSRLLRHLRGMLPAKTARPTLRRQRGAPPRGASKK
jgi:protein required for attachment to host cells